MIKEDSTKGADECATSFQFLSGLVKFWPDYDSSFPLTITTSSSRPSSRTTCGRLGSGQDETCSIVNHLMQESMHARLLASSLTEN